MAGYYVVQINTQIKKKKGRVFLRVDTDRGMIRFVNSKSAATKLETRGVADLISDHFWQHYWERYKDERGLESRSVEFVKSKKRGANGS